MTRLNSEDIEHPKQPPPLSRASKGNDGIQVFLGPGALMGANLTCGSEAILLSLRPCSLIAPGEVLYLLPPQAARAA